MEKNSILHLIVIGSIGNLPLGVGTSDKLCGSEGEQESTHGVAHQSGTSCYAISADTENETILMEGNKVQEVKDGVGMEKVKSVQTDDCRSVHKVHLDKETVQPCNNYCDDDFCAKMSNLCFDGKCQDLDTSIKPEPDSVLQTREVSCANIVGASSRIFVPQLKSDGNHCPSNGDCHAGSPSEIGEDQKETICGPDSYCIPVDKMIQNLEKPTCFGI